MVTVCSGSPDACWGPSSTTLTVGGVRSDRQRPPWWCPPRSVAKDLITGLRRPGRHSVTARRDAPPSRRQRLLSTLSWIDHRRSGPGGCDDSDVDAAHTRAARSWPPDDETLPSTSPLGPDSLTWKYFGDLRTGMMGVWIGAIQNMYPELGAGVEQHSILLREPLQRVARSVYPIMGVVYDGRPGVADRRADQAVPPHHQGRRRQRPPLPRAESRDVLLGARHLFHAGDQGGRILLRRAD